MGFSITLDVSRLERLAGQLDNIGAKEMGRVTRRAVNDTADSIYELARPRMIAGINLTDDYLKTRMEVKPAKDGGKATAVIQASGSKKNMTQLVQYAPEQMIQRVNHSNSEILASGKRFAPWGGWTKRTGSKFRGIPVDEKQNGVSVSVTRGTRKPIEHGFLITLKRGTERGGNGMAIATRSKGALGRNNIKVRYGPSVYQLFNYVATGILDEARDELQDNLVNYATELFEKELR